MLALLCPLIMFAAHAHAFPTLSKINTTTNCSYPYTVAIFQPALSDSSESFICSGVLITPNTVLTIAECVSGTGPSDISIRTGISNPTFQNITVASITSHPGYDVDTLTNDVAVIRLSQNVSIVPALIGTQSAAGNVTIVSWGSMSNNTQDVAPAPKIVSQAVVDAETCASRLVACASEFDAEQHFCTQVTGEGQAYGDGGGPVLDPATGMLVGLISGDPSCAGANFISLQVGMQGFRDWIYETAGL